VGQVQLTELNQEIVNAQALLADTQSIYTQNQMKLEANLSNEEVERYAEDVLGMTKASNAQKEFVTLSHGDKAEVTAQGSENIFTKFIESIQNLWS
jgi:predicted lipid-binding transport protein (Tim44 family)